MGLKNSGPIPPAWRDNGIYLIMNRIIVRQPISHNEGPKIATSLIFVNIWCRKFIWGFHILPPFSLAVCE